MKPTNATDGAELVRRARGGDRAAFAEIVEAYQVPALRLATVIIGDSDEAYDIVQDAFVHAFHALASMHTATSLRSWLLRIVANQAKNVRRSRRRNDARMQRQIRLRTDEVANTDDTALSALAAGELLAAIRQLSRADREIIAYRYFAGLTEAETASALGIAHGTVKSRSARALARLRTRLGDRIGSEA